MQKVFRLKKKDINGIPAELLSPKDKQSEKIILYLHGGGYLYCSINTHRGLASQIAQRTKIPVIIIDYRKAPENKFPTALDDAHYAYKWLITNQSYLPENVIIGGDSAGGGLSMATLLKLKELEVSLPKAVFLMSPWVDLTCSGETMETKKEEDVILDSETLKSWANEYLGEVGPQNPYASPLFGDLSNLPPIYIQVGTAEILYSDAIRLYEKLKEQENMVEIDIWDQMVHVFQLFGAMKFIGKFLPEPKEALANIQTFIEKVYEK